VTECTTASSLRAAPEASRTLCVCGGGGGWHRAIFQAFHAGLSSRGHWADVSCPATGGCLFGERGGCTWNELEGLTQLLRYAHLPAGCCGEPPPSLAALPVISVAAMYIQLCICSHTHNYYKLKAGSPFFCRDTRDCDALARHCAAPGVGKACLPRHVVHRRSAGALSDASLAVEHARSALPSAFAMAGLSLPRPG
jgi:hypothetical protein